ncbi:hypothetical protein DM860_015118 [Cuscuta australis]|uniref:Uncharacterized protein n=1 Tax=Cuscuta australis TaxID=267555 RepID=A0A328DFD2_9ASTE|nr:hypothetical protein DM860_015118 [Cuscuta australis]
MAENQQSKQFNSEAYLRQNFDVEAVVRRRKRRGDGGPPYGSSRTDEKDRSDLPIPWSKMAADSLERDGCRFRLQLFWELLCDSTITGRRRAATCGI